MLSRDAEYYDVVVYVLFGYLLGWKPDDIENMPNSFVAKCIHVLNSMTKDFKFDVKKLSKGRLI